MTRCVGKAGAFGLVLALGLCATSRAGEAGQYLKGRIETNWTITSKYAEIRQSMLYLDALGDKARLAVFGRYKEYVDTSMGASFRVERTGKGEKPFGLIFGSTDSQTYMAVEVRSGVVRLISVVGGKEEKEFGKYAVRDPGDAWQTVSFQCLNSMVRVHYAGKLVFTANLPKRPAGRVGVYAEGARAWVRELTIEGKPTKLAKGWVLVRPAKK